MACVFQKRLSRSQREILEALRCTVQVKVDQNSPSDEGQVDLNPMVTSPSLSPAPSVPIYNFDLTSMDQFMDDQILPNQSLTALLPPINWSLAFEHPIKSTVNFSHEGSIIASVEISEFGVPSTMQKWKIRSPSISPFQHYLGPINVNSKKECDCDRPGVGDETYPSYSIFDKPRKSPFSISIRDRDVFNGSQKILTICYKQNLKLHKCLSKDAPLILTGMNVELLIPTIEKILLTGKNSRVLVHGNVGILKSKEGSIHVSQSIDSASSALGNVCCDTKSLLPWTLPHDAEKPRLKISSQRAEECVLLHDCNLILYGNAEFIMTSSEDIKIDGCCDSIETVWGNIYLTSRNIQKVLMTSGDICVPSTCDVSQVHSKNIKFVDTLEE
jgi:hypothetical protein